MGETALKIGADTFQFFTRNPRGSKAKEIDPEDAKKLLELMEENRFPLYFGTRSLHPEPVLRKRRHEAICA